MTTFTKPEEERPYSAFAPSATTTTSCTASRLNVNAGRWPPRCSPKNGLLKSAPSTETLFWIPFWPLIESSSPSGPWTIETPGVSFVKSMKFRPLFGSDRTASVSIRVVPSGRVVSTTGFSAVTRTSSALAASLIVTATFTDWPTETFSPSRTTFAKPGRVTVTR